MVEGQQLILASWAAMALALAGFGSLLQRLWGAPIRGADGWLRCFWLGWATLLLALQLWHFVMPIDRRALMAVLAIGAVGVASRGRRPWVVFFSGLVRHLPALLAMLLVTWWLSDRAMGGASNGDTGYYYVPTVVWLKSYAIVPGLANLSAPLAYNQTYFHYVALLEAGPLARGSNHLANGLLLLALFARGLLGASRTLRKGGGKPVDVFHLAFLPVSVAMALDLNLTSPAPDFAVFVVGVVLTGEFLAFLGKQEATADALLAVAVLATAAITVKLSLAALAASTLMVACLVAIKRRVGFGALFGVLVIGAAWILPWLAGNVVLSGYPLYPSSVGGFPVDWRVPDDVSGLIRDASSLHGSIALAWQDPKWFLNSLDSLGWNTREVLMPLGLTAGAIVASPLLWLLRRRGQRRPGLPALALVPVVFALVFWFEMAPRPRFAGAALWLMAIETMLVTLGGSIRGRAGKAMVAVLAMALTGFTLEDGGPLLRRLTEFEPTSPPVVHEQTLASGLEVGVAERDICWYAPLPCTPAANPGLRLRDPSDLGRGFAIDVPARQ